MKNYRTISFYQSQICFDKKGVQESWMAGLSIERKLNMQRNKNLSQQTNTSESQV